MTHSYDKRFNYVTHPDLMSCYTDDVAEVMAAIRKHGVTHVSLGYADYEDVPERPGRIGGTMITRRTDQTLTADEFVVEFGGEDFAVKVSEQALAAFQAGALEIIDAHRDQRHHVRKSQPFSFDVSDGRYTATITVTVTEDALAKPKGVR